MGRLGHDVGTERGSWHRLALSPVCPPGVARPLGLSAVAGGLRGTHVDSMLSKWINSKMADLVSVVAVGAAQVGTCRNVGREMGYW